MEPQQLLEKINGLPSEARQELERFLIQLKWRYAQLTPPTSEDLAPFTDPEFYGAWADRPDITDSTEYARALRQAYWQTKSL